MASLPHRPSLPDGAHWDQADTSSFQNNLGEIRSSPPTTMGGMQTVVHFVRTHLGVAIAATAAAVVLVGGLLAFTLIGGGGSQSAAAGPSSTTSTSVAGANAKGGSARANGRGVRGQITAMTASTWTVKSSRGTLFTVEVSPTTTFGTPSAPLRASDFSVGDQIAVIGTRTKKSVVATRIAKEKAAAGASAASTTVP
jgi:hypothetical protein